MNEELDTKAAVTGYLNQANVQPDPARSARASMSLAVDTNPDFEAELRKVAKKTGVPIDSARAYPEQVKQQATLNTIDFNDLAQRFPKTAAYLSGVENAKVAHDDVENLKMMEAVISGQASMGRIGGPAYRRQDSVQEYSLKPSVGSVLGGLGEALKFKPLREGLRLAIHDALFDDGSVDAQVYRADILRKTGQAQAQQNFATPDFESSTAAGLYSGGVSLLQNTPGIIASIFAGNPAPAIALGSLNTGVPAYSKYIGRGGSKTEATVGAVGEGAVEAATELLPMGFLVNKFGKVGAKEFLAGLLGRELPSEQVATLLQDAIDTAVANPDKTWEQYVQERPDAAYKTLLATLVQSGTMGAVNTIATRAQRRELESQRAEQGAQVIQQINELAKASNLARRDADSFEQFIAQVTEDGPVQDVYISAQTLAQSGVAEQLAALSPAVAEQLPTALATNGDIRIPVAEYAARIANTEYAQGLLDHLKLDDQGKTLAETREDTRAEIQEQMSKLLDEKQLDDTFKASIESVKTQVRQQLDQVGRFTGETNDLYATMWANMFGVMGAKLGVSPQQLFDQYPLRVTAEGMGGGQVLEQGNIFDVQGLSREQERDLIQGEAQKLAALLRDEGFQVTLEHSGSAAGPSSYLRVFDPQTGRFIKNDIRLSGHSKGPFNSASVWDVATADDYQAVLKTARDMRAMGMSAGMAAMQAQDDARLLKSADKKIAKGKPLTKSEQEAVDRRNNQLNQSQPAFDGTETGNTPIGDAQTVNVDGVERTVFNSNGKPIHPTLEGVRNFWRWFGDSKVVDAQGHPLVVYHGTASKFTTFSGARGVAGYFTPDREAAQHYADNADAYDADGNYVDGESTVMQVYLSVKNPVVLEEAWAKENLTSDYDGSRDWTLLDDMIDMVGWRNSHDGIHLKGVEDFAGIVDGKRQERAYDQWVAFSPNQIKSATGNAGTFDPENPNILMQSVFHGSPHRFDKFTLDAMGTGEGAQAYGWGLYFAGKKEVAEYYRETLAGDGFMVADGQVFDPSSLKHMNIKAIARKGDIDAAITKARDIAQSDSPVANLAADDLATLEDIKARGGITKNTGQLYEVNIPEDDTMLLWDKPLSEQPAKVREAVNQLALWLPKTKRPKISDLGETIYQMLVDRYHNAKDASVTLNAAGISGIKYLDGSSRSDGEGSYNYVIFDDNAVEILNTYYQRRNQGNRGSFNPGTNTITLLKNADLSTFLHETGHFFLEMQLDIASKLAAAETRTAQQEQVLKDTDALLKWFGVSDLQTWYSLDFEEKRSYHEQFARGFEAYLFEGKAPNLELQGMFQRFRAWLLNIYRDLKNLNVQLTDEVRGVFDRMLATTEQIKLAEQARSMTPMFESPEKAGMSVDEFAAYQALGTDASNEAIQDLQARGLRDMQWLNNTRGREIKRLKKESEVRRAEVRSGVRTEVMSQPIYRAWSFLTSKAQEGGEPTGKLSREALGDMYGGEGDKYALYDWKRLTDLRMTAQEGLHPDVVAEMFGYSSGDELVRALVSAPNPNEEIEGLTDARMLEQYGELATPEAIERAADKAIHNDVRARMVATEVNALAKATGKPRILASAAKELANTLIGRIKVRDIRPGQYVTAEVRAAKAAEKAYKSGDLETAAAEKRNQLVNTYLTRAAYNAQDEFEKGMRFIQRFKTPGKLPAEYYDRVLALLDKFDLRKSVTNAEIESKTSFATWVKAQLKVGEIPPNFETLLAPQARKELAAELATRDAEGELVYADEEAQADLIAQYLDAAPVRNIRDVTVEEFRGLVDTLKQIDHVGRRTQRVLTDRKNRLFADVVQGIRDNVEAVATRTGRESKDVRSSNTTAGKIGELARSHFFSHVKASALIEVIDGKQGGPMWETLVATANSTTDAEVLDIAKYHDRVKTLLRGLQKDGNITDTAKSFPSIGRSLNRQARIAMAMNMGNESNMQRLLGGEGWTLEQIKPVLDTLTAADWNFVQSMWDLYEENKPNWVKVYREINGVEPEMVEPMPLTVQTADGQTLNLRGGYAPVVYDPRGSGRAQSFADSKDAEQQLRAARVNSTVNKSFTKARVEEVTGRPVLLSLDALINGLQDTVHYTHWAPWIIDANRIVKALDSTVRKHYGAEAISVLRDWVSDTAAGVQAPRDGAERMIAWAAKNVSFTALAMNVLNAAQQVTGISSSIVTLGAGGSAGSGYTWFARGMAHVLTNRTKAYREAVDKSAFMRKRATTMLRDLNETANVVQDQGRFAEFSDKYGYALTQMMQVTVDLPTWWAAYHKAGATQGGFVVNEDGSINDERAVALADQAVIDSQGSGAKKDLARYERATGAMRILSGFMSYMNATFNQNYRIARSERNVVRKAHDLLLINTIPVLGMILLKSLLVPSDGGDEPEKLAKKAAAEQIAFIFGQMIGLREVSQLGGAIVGEPFAGQYGGPVGMRAAADVLKLAQQIGQGETDIALVKALISVAGDIFRLPSVQINRTITGANALDEGDTDNPTALVFGFKRDK